MNVENGAEAAQFFFWEFLFLMFGIVSLQCSIRQPWILLFHSFEYVYNVKFS